MALTDEEKMQIIKQATSEGYKGSFQELFDQQETSMAPEQSAQPMEQMPEQPMQPPMQTGDMPSMQQMQDGDLVQSYASEAPGIGNMPMGEDVGNILESASTYKEGGFKGIKYADKFENGGIKYPTNKQGLVTYDGDMRSFTLDPRKDSYINKQLATGKFGYDPTTGALVKLTPKKQIEVSAKDQTIIDRGQQFVKEQEKTIPLNDTYGIDFSKPSAQHQMFDLGYSGLSVKPEYQRLADDYISGKNQNDLARDAYMRIGQQKGNEAFSLVAGSVIPIGKVPGLSKYAPKVGKVLKNTLKFDPSSSFGAAYNLPKEMIKNRSFRGGLKSYRTGLKGKSKLGTTGNVLKESVGAVHSTFAPKYAMDALSPHKDAEKSALSLTELAKVKHPYLNMGVNMYKAGKDIYKGQKYPEDAAYYNTSAGLRLASTAVDKFLPKSITAKIFDPEQIKSLTTTGKSTFDLVRKTNKHTGVGKE